ncbi:peptidase [Planococcus antarcticus DSM 14505]|uniref:Peptidase n=1 Tax=Planococcus antarcticus DSM 14505 TaxID=1185653 RepID=A0ABM6D5U5_9BACL|nr:M1 family metallopeptidase [Planococcus antarcticus]ANU10730.1 peptidase [Planococcus antarcticus DSM 14505]
MKLKGWAAVIIVVVGVSVFLMLRATVFCEECNRQETEIEKDATNAVYNLKLTLSETKEFQVAASINVTNDSADSWSELGFYLVPNAMNSEETPLYEDENLLIEISSVSVNGEDAEYKLDNNEFLVELDTNLEPESAVKVVVDYSMVLPQNGMRLSQVDDNFYLAHWYPMLGHYQDGWDIKDYNPTGESYDTDYGDFTVSYDLPKDYLVASSAEDGIIEAASTGTVKGENIKDFYLAIMNPDEWETETVQANDTALRVFTPLSANMLEETSELAVESYLYFEENIGDNPFGELDIIGNDGYMEYPNIIEVAADEGSQESVLVHEIAHQWFYFIVTNDPYNESWLDEGITEFSSSLFLSDLYDDDEYGFWGASTAEQYYPPETYVNLPLDKFDDNTYYSTIYGKVPMVLKAYFDENGGRETALRFLSAYYAEFQFGQVNTEEFKEFFEEYFEEDQSKFLNSWLK